MACLSRWLSSVNLSFVDPELFRGYDPKKKVFHQEIELIHDLEPFEAAVRVLNPVVAIKIRSAAIHAALATVCVISVLCPLPLVRGPH